MPSNVTLAALISRAQSRADMVDQGFVSTAEWTAWANSSATDFYDKVSQADPERYLSTTTLTLTPPAVSVNLPTDFYKLLRVDLLYGSGTPQQFYTLRKFNLLEEDANQYPAFVSYAGPTFRYRLRTGTVDFTPAPNSESSIRLLYLPVLTQFVATSDSIDAINGWEEMIVLDMAIAALLKENATDVSALIQERGRWAQKIDALALERDTSFPEQTVDVTRNSGRFPWNGWDW